MAKDLTLPFTTVPLKIEPNVLNPVKSVVLLAPLMKKEEVGKDIEQALFEKYCSRSVELNGHASGRVDKFLSELMNDKNQYRNRDYIQKVKKINCL